MPAFIILPYLAIGAILSIIGYFTGTAWYFAKTPRMSEGVLAVAAFQRQNKGFARIKWEVMRLLIVPAIIVGWPAITYMGSRTSGLTRPKRVRAMGLMPSALLTAVCTLCFAGLLTILRLLAGPHWSILVGCAALLACLLASMVVSTLAKVDLPGQLRVNLMRPYVQFILIAAVDYLSLLLAAVLVERLQTGNEISREVILQQIRGLSAFTHVITAIRNTPLAPLTLLLTAVGVAYFAMIGRLVSQYRQFTRRPEDHASIVAALAASGKSSSARQWFYKQDQQTRNHSSMLAPRIWLDLEAREYDKAYQLMEAVHSMSADGSLIYATRSPDSVLYRLIDSTLSYGMEESVLQGVVDFAVKRGISDAAVTLLLPASIAEMEVKSPEVLLDLGISKEQYPMATSLIMWLTTESSAVEDAALEQLASVASNSKTDRLVQLLWMVAMALNAGQQPIDVVEDLLSELTDVSDLPGWFRFEFSYYLLAIGRGDRLEETSLRGRIIQRRATLLEGANADEVALVESIGNVMQRILP